MLLKVPKTTGRYCIEAAKKGARAVGVEILPEAVVNARQRVKEGDYTHQLPRENLKYPSCIIIWAQRINENNYNA
eukprot:scaffold423869_cov15-Prasinocladus_malaysianus.AAC.1